LDRPYAYDDRPAVSLLLLYLMSNNRCQSHLKSKIFSSPAYAVVGASVNQAKFGNKVLRCYLQHNKKVEIKVFLFSNAVYCAKQGQLVP
jgi:hypothetical protein